MLVDPQGQGRQWIQNREEANQLKARAARRPPCALPCIALHRCRPASARPTHAVHLNTHAPPPPPPAHARPQVTQLGDKQFRLALEDCLAFGKPLLIENIEEELDPVLDPVLERRLVGGGEMGL